MYDKRNRPIRNLFETNRWIKDTEMKLQPKPGNFLIKHQARHKPYHLQSYVENQSIKKLESRLLEKIQNVQEDCFLSPLVNIWKKTKSLKNVVDA